MYKKILVPLDGSKAAECTLEHVKQLSKIGAIGEVVLIQVIESPLPSYWTAVRVDLFEQIEAEWGEHAKGYLKGIQSQLSSEGIESRTEILESYKASPAIVQYAKENDIDLIIIASQGHSGVMHWVFGSVALKVLHDSPVPVLLIRPALNRPVV